MPGMALPMAAPTSAPAAAVAAASAALRMVSPTLLLQLRERLRQVAVVLLDEQQRHDKAAWPVAHPSKVELHQDVRDGPPRVADRVCGDVADRLGGHRLGDRLAVLAHDDRRGIGAQGGEVDLVVGALKPVVVGVALDEIAQAELQAARRLRRVQLHDRRQGAARGLGAVDVSGTRDDDELASQRHHEAIVRVESDLRPTECVHRLERSLHHRAHRIAGRIDADVGAGERAGHVGAVDRAIGGDDDERLADGHHEAVLWAEADGRSVELLHRGQEPARAGAHHIGPEHGSVAGDHDERVRERHHEAVLRVEADQGAAELEDGPELPVHNVGAVDQPVVADDDERVAGGSP
jgi:hypothetical protein